jgi:hypothetical protein
MMRINALQPFNQQTLPTGIQKKISYVWRIGLATSLVFLLAGMLLHPVRANSPAQSTGHWRYVRTDNIVFDVSKDNDKWNVYKNSISDGGGYYYHGHGNEQTSDPTDLDILEIKCTWAVTSPNSLDTLMPGDTLEATANCTDTSKKNSQGQESYIRSSLKFALEPPGAVENSREKVVFDVDPGFQQSNTTKDTVNVPSLIYWPAGNVTGASPSGNGNQSTSVPTGDKSQNKLALMFFLNGAGYSERVYDWVAGGAAGPLITQPAPGGNGCTATLTPNGDIIPGREIYFNVNVVNDQNAPVAPQDGTWLYNRVGSTNGNMKWDGKAATVEYQYTCPVNGQRLSTSYAISPQDDGSGWIVIAGGAGAVAAAGLAAAAGGVALIATSSKKNVKQSNPPQPPRYILQLDPVKQKVNSREMIRLKVKPGEKVPLVIKAWRINPNGSTVPAPEALIHLAIPPSPAGLMVSPESGKGILSCAFYISKPTICTDLVVGINASASGFTAQTQVKVSIVPNYELKLDWAGSPPGHLQPGSKEVYACASLSAIPQPDAQSTPDVLAGKINLSAQGPNSEKIRIQCAAPAQQGMFVRQGFLWIPVIVLLPDPGTSFQPGNPSLVATFICDDQRLEQRLLVDMNEQLDFDAWVQGKKQVDVLFNQNLTPPAWDFSDIRAYFHAPNQDNIPAHPSFPYQVTVQSVECDPPVLDVNDIQTDKDLTTLCLNLKPGLNLEQFMGKDLCAYNGTIKVKISFRGENNQPYTAQITYQLRPQLELFAHGQDIHGREYKKINLGALEFVSDGDDLLGVMIGCCRTDQPGPRDIDQIEQVDPGWWNFKGSLQGAAASDYQAHSPEEDQDDKRMLLVKSTKPLLYNPGRKNQKMTLHLEASLNASLPRHYLRSPLLCDLPLKPRFPDLRLWVVPGKERHTSEAWMMTFLDGNTSQALAETILILKLHKDGGEDGVNLDTYLNLQDQQSVSTGEDGSEQVILRYNGLNWSNYKEAVFTVSCTITNKAGDQESEAVKTSINIKENVERTLYDLFESAQSLKLNNPYWKDRSLGLTSLIDLTVYRPFVRGPVWNACEELSGNEGKYAAGNKKTKFAHDYVCSEFRDRIAEWLIKRRHYHRGNTEEVINKMTTMNGIEFENYIVASGLHNYEAIFLSGMSPTEDPRGLDPWWKQAWDDANYLHPEQLISNGWERYYCAETASWMTVSLVPAIALGLATGGATVSVSLAALGPIIAAYASATVGEEAPGKVYTDREYKWFKGNHYAERHVFITDWVTDNPNG